MTEDSVTKFKYYLEQVTGLFNQNYDKDRSAQLRWEIDQLDRSQLIENWLSLLKKQGPVEKVSDLKYEIYDVSNFLGEAPDSSNDYVHVVDLTEFESSSSVFMKFYLVFFCLINGVRSTEYDVSFVSGGWM